MGKTFIVDGTEYTVEPVTAIAASIGDHTRQNALLVTSMADSGEKIEYVVFGFDMPEDEGDFANMCSESSAWDSSLETLESMKRAEEKNVRILKMRDVMTAEAYEGLTSAERRRLLKVEQAKEYSGLRRYPSTCAAVFDRIPSEWWGKYNAQHIGEVAELLKAAYDDGKAYGLEG